MTSDNPDTDYFNDDNRPTKLAEKFGQVYDDLWTDAIEELTRVETRLDDRTAISILLRIVMVLLNFYTIIIIIIIIVYMITFKNCYQAPFFKLTADYVGFLIKYFVAYVLLVHVSHLKKPMTFGDNKSFVHTKFNLVGSVAMLL